MDIHSEPVGSLLRPSALLDARARLAAGALPPDEFKALEDAAVEEAIRLQQAAGLDVITDGELRREGWSNHFIDSVSGFQRAAGTDLPWRFEGGAEPDAPQGGSRRPVVVERLRWRRSACAEEWTFLRGRASHPAKVTFVSTESAAGFYDPELSRDAYPTMEDFLADVVDLFRQEVEELVRLGCTYIQLDAPQYGALLDPQLRRQFAERGQDPDRMIDAGIEMDNAVIKGFDDVTFGLHVCRGNKEGRFYAEGDYHPISRLFERTDFDRLLLEYDDERSGDFEPLRHVRDDCVVVLGLVSTKRSTLETEDGMRAKVKEANRYLGLEQLAVSPQCGFASTIVGNQLDAGQQQSKLELVTQVARSIWGEEG